MSFVLLGILNSQAAAGGSEHWIAAWSAGGNELTLDSSDNIYLAGIIDGNDHCLLALDPFGNLQWDRKLVITAHAESAVPAKLVTDGTYLYTAGISDNGGSYDNLLTRYELDGTFDRTRWVGTGSYDTASTLVLGASHVYVGGWFPAGDVGGVYKINKDFSTISWYGKQNGPGNSFVRDIAIDSSENTIHISSYSTQYNIMKLNSSGARQWERQLVGIGAIGGYSAIATDSSDNIYACVASNRSGAYSFCVVKWNSSGTMQWIRELQPTSGNSYPRGIHVDSSGNVFVNGYTTDGGGNNILFAKWDSSGAIQWQRRLYSSNNNYGIRITTDSVGNVILTAGDSGQSTIIAKLPEDGSGTGTYVLDGVTWTYAVNTHTETASIQTDGGGSFGFGTGYSLTISTPSSSESAASGTIVKANI